MAQTRLPKDQKRQKDAASSQKRGEASQSNDNQDPPPSVKQIALVMWLAEYKKVELPPKVRTSYRHWWLWINITLTRIDREDAHAIARDFPQLTVDLNDPISVIGALKYRDAVDTLSPEEEAIAMLLNGTHPYTVEGNLMLTPDQLKEAVKKVELGGFEIEWGSV